MAEEDKAVNANEAGAGTAGNAPAEPVSDAEKLGTTAKNSVPEESEALDPSIFVVPPLDGTNPLFTGGAPMQGPAPIAQKSAIAVPPGAEKSAVSAENPKPEIPPFSVPVPVQSKTGAELKKKSFPSPQELRTEKKAFPNIPSAVKLEDIQLPSYMKGVLSKPTPVLKPSPRIERSIREIGIGAPPVARKKIVSIAADKRTEIDENGLPRIRTYAEDMSQEIRRRGATLSTIVGAEREREAERKAHVDERFAVTRHRLMLLLGAAVFVMIGVGVVAGVLIVIKEDGPVTVEISIIPENKKVRIDVESGDIIPALAKERVAADLSLGEIERFVVTDGVNELTPEALLTRLGAPPELARNADHLMIGIHSFDRNQPFIIVQTRYYDLTFGAMLEWEPKMAKTLGALFTPVTATGLPLELHFTDSIYKNIDVRKSESAWPILYAFPEEDLLIVTTNTNTLTEILTRLSISKTR